MHLSKGWAQCPILNMPCPRIHTRPKQIVHAKPNSRQDGHYYYGIILFLERPPSRMNLLFTTILLMLCGIPKVTWAKALTAYKVIC